jgi:hypothetical protein
MREVIEMPPEMRWISTIVTVFLILWTGLAVFATVKPLYFWRITQGWKATKEPPRAYFVMHGIGTAICAAIGILLLLLPYLHS